MSDATENLLLEHMKAFRSKLKEMRSAMHDESKELEHRVTQLELDVIGAPRQCRCAGRSLSAAGHD